MTEYPAFMGFSYGVGIMLGKKCSPPELESVVSAQLDDLRSKSLSFSVHHAARLTLLAQAGPDDDRLWNELERTEALAATLAEHLTYHT